MVFRLGAGAVAEVVVPLCLAKAGFLSGCTVVLGIVAATEERYTNIVYYYSIIIIYSFKFSSLSKMKIPQLRSPTISNT
jgi:hypothetical protein